MYGRLLTVIPSCSADGSSGLIQDIAQRGSSLLTGIRQRASQAGEQVSQSISDRSQRRDSLRQRLGRRRGGRNGTSVSGGAGFDVRVGGLSVSADFNNTLRGDIQRGVADRVNSGSSLRTRLADRVGSTMQSGIGAALNGANTLNSLAQGGLSLGTGLTDGLVSRTRQSGDRNTRRNRNRLQTARNLIVSAVDTATNLADAGLTVGNTVGNRVLDGVSGLSRTASGMASAGLNLASGATNGVGGMVSGMVDNAVNSARSATGILRNPLSTLGATRDVLGRVSGEASLSVNGPLGSFSLKYGGEDN